MRNHRLNRLALLTQGIALVGFGISTTLACGDPPHVNSAPPQSPEPPHVNAPPSPGPVASPSAADAGAADPTPPATPPPTSPIHVNSPPKKPPSAPKP